MYDGENHPPFGANQAEKILNAGWRQGTPFRPPAGFPIDKSYDAVTEWLIVCTQSCSVVSDSLEKNPAIEVVAAKTLDTFNPKSQEARGKNVRHFQLPVSGILGVKAFQCDINRRFAIPREALLRFTPEDGVIVSAEDARSLAGWIARYYTRIALPNELVRRLQDRRGLFEIVKKALEKKMSDDKPLHSGINGIFIRWEPDAELAPRFASSTDLYRIDLIFLCEEAEAETLLEQSLQSELERFTDDGGHDGIYLMWDSKRTSTTFVSEIAAYSRLSEWDYLSNLAEVAESCDKLSSVGD